MKPQARLHLPILFCLIALPARAALVYSSGHADLAVGFYDGALDFHFHAEGATIGGVDVDDEEYEPAEIVILVSTAAMVTLPTDFPALGAGAGQSIWRLPENENVMLPFLGISTDELVANQWGNLSFSLGAVNPPDGGGHFALWQTGSFGEILLHMSTALDGVNLFEMPANTHSHHNYGFTTPGTWEIEFIVSGTHADHGLVTGSETFTFMVVPEPSTALLAAAGLLPLLRRRR